MIIERLLALTGDDRDKILAFWVAAWSPVIPAIDFAARRDWLSEHLDSLLGDGALLLVTRAAGGAPTGFLTLHPGTGEVDQIAVDPAHAGEGLGRALLDEAKRLSPTGLNLRVNTVNHRAARVYRAAGFIVTGEDFSVRSGLPVWTMAWRGTP